MSWVQPRGLLPIYIRGEAYLHAKRGAEAVQEFQKIADHRGIDPTFAEHSLAKLGLGRAYKITGNTAKARAAYQDFFAAALLGRIADPDVAHPKRSQSGIRDAAIAGNRLLSSMITV